MKKLVFAATILLGGVAFGQTNISDKVELEYFPISTNSKFVQQDYAYLNEDEIVVSSAESHPFIAHKLPSIKVDIKTVNLKTLAETNTKREFDGTKKFHGVIGSNSTPFLITSDFDIISQQSSVFLENLNDKSTIKIFNVREVGKEGSFEKTHSPNGQLTLLKHNSYGAIISAMAGTPNKNKTELFQIAILDKELNKKWDKLWNIPFSPELFKQEDLKIDNNGNVFLLLKVYNKKRDENVKGLPNYYHIVYGFLNNGEIIKEYKISHESLFYHVARMQLDDNGTLFIAGLASNKTNWNKSTSGFFFSKFNIGSGKQEFQNDYDLSQNTFTEFLGNKDKEALIRDVNLDGFETDSKNGFYLFGSRVANDFNSTTGVLSWDKLFQIKIDQSGKVVFEDVIQRNFTSSNTSLGSSSVSNNGEANLFFYNHPKYRDASNKNTDVFSNNLYHDYTLYVNRFNSENKIEFMPLADFFQNQVEGSGKGLPNCRTIRALSPNVFAIDGSSGNNQGVWIIKFK